MSDPLLRKLKRNEENRNRREKARKRLLAVQEATNNDWRANLSAKPSNITKTTTPQAKNSHNSFSNSKSPIVLLRQQSTESKKRLSFGNSPLKNTATTKKFTTSIDEKWLDLSPSQNETDQDAKMPKVSSRKSSRQEDSAKRLFFESPSRSTTKSSTTTRFSIGDEWLDSPRAKTKWEDSSKKLAASNPKSTSSSQDSQLLMSSKKPAPVKRRPPPQPLDDSSDEEPDLLGAFLEQQKRKKGGERPSQDKWKRTSHEFSSENAGKNSRSPSPPTRKSLGTSSIDEDAASPPPIRNSLNRSLMDDSSDEEDTSFTTRRKKRPLRNGDAIPHNPIALVNQERSRSTDMARESSPPQLKTSNASLWSDSENEEVEEEEEEYLKKKIKKKRKSSDSSSPQKRSKTTDLYDDSIEDCADNRELLAQDEETFRQTLKPELKNPYFGPFALEPLILEGGEDQQEQKEVPAALSRYLADFQREGVQFLYKCLSAKKGAILGHDMGLGKTVQIIALLSALYEKTGTGLDLLELQRRERVVREKTQKRQRQQEQDLLYGRVAANGDSATSAGPSWRQELKFPDWYPILLIVPTTVVQNWRNEFARFSHFSVATFDSDNRQKALESFSNGGAEIMLAAKSLFAQDRGFRELNKFPWKLVIIDEFHMFKNPKGQLSTKLRKLKSDHRSLVLGMTGTLFQNDHMELWNLVDLVETGYLGDWDEFRNTTGKAIKLGRSKVADESTIRRSNEHSLKLKQQLEKIFIERKKEDVLGEKLPDKSEQVIFCEPSSLQKRVYQHILTLPDFELLKNATQPCDCGVNKAFFQKVQRLSSKAERINYGRNHRNDIVKQKECCYRIPLNPYREAEGQPYIDPDAVVWRMMDCHDGDHECDNCPTCCFFPAANKLNLVCSHLSLLQADRAPGWNEEGSPEYRKYMKTLEFGKVAFPREVVNKLPGASLICKDGIMDDHFALSGKLEVLDKLLTKYKEENSRALLFSYSTKTLDLIQNYVRSVGYSFDRMDGKTANTRRQEIADKFNKDPSIFLLLLSTKAMGVGLNLTAANRVIIFDVEWNPSWDEQAQDRAYRIGQLKNVQVVRLVSRGTLDELKYLRQLYKVQLKQETLQRDDSSAPQKAPRMFRGVQGDKDRQGELFGVANMMRFKDGCFLDDVWKQNRRKSGGLDIHETTKLKEKVIRIGADKCEEILEEEPDLDNFLEPVGGSGSKTEELSGDQESRNESSDNEAKDRLDLEIEGQAVNHGDLFRSDRGGAAIEEGEEGFDEEMGIQTQNVFAVYEQGGMELPENPQDGNFSDAEDVSNQNVQGVDNQQAGTSPGSVQPRSAHADAFRFEETEHAVGNVPSAPTRTQQGQASSIPSKIKLVGTIVSAETQSPAKTTFSAADLFLPTYGKKKSKKGKKKKK